MDMYQTPNISIPTFPTMAENDTAWDLVHAILPPYIFTVSVVGILGNAFVLGVFLLQRAKWSVPEIYLGNLALADLVMLALLPFWGVNVLNDYNWPFGEFMCIVVSLSLTTNMYTSVFLLAMISVDRYLALVQTMKARWLRRTCYAKAVCAVLWVLGVAVCAPVLPHRKLEYDPEYRVMSCFLDYPHDSWRVAHHVLLNLMGFALPFLAISFCSVNVVRALNQRRDNACSSDRSDRKATTLVYAVTLFFLVCWGPFHLFTFLDVLCDFQVLEVAEWQEVTAIGNQFATYFAFLNSSLNPVLYVCTGQYFRRKLSEIYRRYERSRGSDVTTQRSVVSTLLHKTDHIRPVVL
ncbi:B1 bradykinin receptor [Alosa pseudoharengus]|uniref:B1 bradykinin receptor n=1 Tax=Alosa pseudoharengus TaxID=34774 RepID=UPI003F8A2789